MDNGCGISDSQIFESRILGPERWNASIILEDSSILNDSKGNVSGDINNIKGTKLIEVKWNKALLNWPYPSITHVYMCQAVHFIPENKISKP